MSKVHASFMGQSIVTMVSVLLLYIECMYVCMYVCMYKFYDCLPNAGEMFWMFLSCHTAAGLLVNSCEWNCYWLENGALVLQISVLWAHGNVSHM